MQFHSRKRRSPPAIIIVALIDVLIVMLIFLMVTTTFKQQHAMKLALPESRQAEKVAAAEDAPVVISIDEKGNMRLGGEVEGIPMTTENLRTELMERAGKNPELRLAINADKAAPFGQIVKVMDAAKDAKISYISAFAKEPPKQP